MYQSLASPAAGSEKRETLRMIQCIFSYNRSIRRLLFLTKVSGVDDDVVLAVEPVERIVGIGSEVELRRK